MRIVSPLVPRKFRERLCDSVVLRFGNFDLPDTTFVFTHTLKDFLHRDNIANPVIGRRSNRRIRWGINVKCFQQAPFGTGVTETPRNENTGRASDCGETLPPIHTSVRASSPI
jgi:hypothetical protein